MPEPGVLLLSFNFGSRVASRWMGRHVSGATRVHLGCGPNLLPGWANLDMDGPKGVTRFDLNRPLPFPASSVDFVFSEHFVEHVRLEQADSLLRECARILRPGGVVRISTPDLRRLVDEYVAGTIHEWDDMGWSPETPCDLLNEGMRMWGHTYVFDEPRLSRALAEAGFGSVTRVVRHDSEYDALRGLETRPEHGDLILEAVR